MKKTYYTLLVLLLSLHAFSQIEKGKTLLSLEGNYLKTLDQTGVSTNGLEIKSQEFNVGCEIEYFLSNRFSIAVGLDYLHQKDDRYFQTFLNNQFVQMEDIEIKQKAILPKISLSYYHKIIEKFYFSGSLSIAYGVVISEYETMISVGRPNPYGGGLSASSSTKEDDTENELSGIILEPKLHYFFTDRFGISLGLGGIEYAMIDWESENSSFGVDFSPKYWSIGFRLIL